MEGLPDRKSIGVYFSYHQERDRDRAEIVMSFSDSTERDRLGIWNEEEWNKASAKGAEFVDERIEIALEQIDVTCLLIGESTVEKPWIRPVLRLCHKLGKGIFAVYIHSIPDYSGNVCRKGPNPMGNLKYTGKNNMEYPYAGYYFTYDWKLHDGPNRFNRWVEIAARQVQQAEW